MSKSIIILSLNDKMGGAEQYLKMVANYYLHKGYSIDVFFLTKSSGKLWDDISDQVNLYFTGAVSEKNGFLKLISNIVKNKGSYHYGFTSHIYLNTLLSLLRKLNLIHIQNLIARDSHSYYLADKGLKLKVYDFLIKMGYSGVDLLISQTTEMKNQMIKHNQKIFRKVKIEVIPNPVDFSAVSIDNNLTFERKTIVSAGRLIKIKGFDILIKAFSQLETKDYNLIILGEGDERVNLEKLIRELNLENRVFLPGFTKDVYSYFHHASICVVSSIKEGFPNVLLQMMSQNNNVVTTLCAGDIDQIKGLVFAQSNDVDSLTKALSYKIININLSNEKVFEKELKKRQIDNFISNVDLIVKST